MADIVVGTPVQNLSTPGSSNNTFAVTVPAGYNALLVLITTFSDDGDTAARPASVTYNGSALTKLRDDQGLSGTNNWSAAWLIMNPTTGSSLNVVATQTSGTNSYLNCIAIPLQNVKSGSDTAPDAVNGGTTSSSSTSALSMTTVADRCVTFSVETTMICGSIAVTSPGVSLYTSACDGAQYKTLKTPAGSVTHNYTGADAADNWVGSIVSLAPAAAATGNSNFLAFF